MSKIFKIEPISTIESALEGMHTAVPPKEIIINNKKYIPDTVEINNVKKSLSNPVIKKRNGIGKLMSHFSKPKIK